MMELIKTEYNRLKRSFNNFVIKRGEEIIESQMGGKLYGDVLISKGEKFKDFEICVFDLFNNKITFNDNFFKSLNAEIDENLKTPISDGIKANYLNEIYSFMISKETQFIEDDFGYLSCNLFSIQYDETPYNWRDEIFIEHEIRSLRRCLRKEIVFISDLLFKYDQKASSINMSMPQFNWEGTDTDLLELIVALIETKSISKDHKKISRKEAIRIFEQIFSIEIKDAESKLSRATERKINNSPFLTLLKNAFETYSKAKEE